MEKMGKLVRLLDYVFCIKFIFYAKKNNKERLSRILMSIKLSSVLTLIAWHPEKESQMYKSDNFSHMWYY